MLIGHEKLRHYFDETIAGSGLAHTYCLIGPSQIGKRTLVQEVGAQLLKTTPEKLASHPDYYFVGQATDEKTGKLKKDISVEQARDLRIRLQNRSWLGGYQVVIIDGAELLNAESGNALLKILEEPPATCIIFLITENDEVLLPTIRSRSQLLYMGLVTEAKIVSGLKQRGVSAQVAEEATARAWGRPGKAIELAEDEEQLALARKEVERCRQLIDAPFYTKLALVEDLFGDKEDAVRGRERLVGALDVWTLEWRKRLLNGDGSKLIIKKNIDNILETQQLLQKNIHPRLAVEQLILGF